MKKHLEVLGEFLGHLAMGVAFFTLLVLASLLISALTHWVGGFEVGKDLVPVLRFVEHVLLYGDCVFMVWWVLHSTYKGCKAL